jgi:hypothetical protein
VRDHHTVTDKPLIESDLLKKTIDTRMKSESFNMLELTAEFGNRLVNFLRELNEVMSPAAFSNLEQVVRGGKGSWVCLNIFNSLQTTKDVDVDKWT